MPFKSQKQRAEYNREYRLRNRERINANHRRWSQANPERVLAYHRTVAGYARHRRLQRSRNLGLDVQGTVYAAILVNDPCSYCGGPGGEVDHITPLSAGGTGTWDNLTAACRSCNARKGTKRILYAL